MTTDLSNPSPHLDLSLYWNKSEVLARGWTAASITKFLGAPDETRRNPRRRKGPRIQLFTKDRVVAVEATADWQQWQAASAVRRQSALDRADRAREQTYAAARQALDTLELAPQFCGLSAAAIREQASASFLRREQAREQRSRGRYTAEQITSRRSAGFFDRIMVNWLRHEGTRYDHSLDEYFNLVGVDVAKDMIRERAYELIAAEYPFLADECQRQLAHRRGNTLRRTGKDVSRR